jgi:3-hydroxybutyryl-CoA dehydratase
MTPVRPSVASISFEELSAGHEVSFEQTVTAEMIDRFAEISGDVSPLHVDGAFARGRGYPERVAHGALLVSLVSRLVGVHCPGRDALLLSVNLRFHKPVFPDATLRVKGIVDQVSAATRTLVLVISIQNVATGDEHARGKVQVGFTSAADGSVAGHPN